MIENIHQNNTLYYPNLPTCRISLFNYLFIPFILFYSKITNKTLILNIPNEIVQSVEFVPLKPSESAFKVQFCYERGLLFVNFVERLRKILAIKVYWLNKDEIINIPKDIQLIFFIKKQKLKAKKILRFLHQYKNQIKAIITRKRDILSQSKFSF